MYVCWSAKFVLTLINVLVLINILPRIFPKFNKRPDLNKNVLGRKMSKLNKNVQDYYSEVYSIVVLLYNYIIGKTWKYFSCCCPSIVVTWLLSNICSCYSESSVVSWYRIATNCILEEFVSSCNYHIHAYRSPLLNRTLPPPFEKLIQGVPTSLE